MSLAMNRFVFIACALTRSCGMQDKPPQVPHSPKQKFDAALDVIKGMAAKVIGPKAVREQLGQTQRNPLVQA